MTAGDLYRCGLDWCSDSGGSWWLFGIGLAVAVWMLWREVKRDR